MTTTSAPVLLWAPPRPLRLSPAAVRGARIAGWAMLGLTLLALPGRLLLAAEPGPLGRAVTAFLFFAVAVLDALVGWGLWRLTRPAATVWAALSLAGRWSYALTLAWGSVVLTLPAAGGVDAFLRIWDVALALLGAHLVVTAVAVRATGDARTTVTAATAAAGAAYLLDALPGGWHVLPSGLLLPFMAGELVLLAWLFVVGMPEGGSALRTVRPVERSTSAG